MATYEITSPAGDVYEVTAPDNATQEEVWGYVQSQLAQQAGPPPATNLLEQFRAEQSRHLGQIGQDVDALRLGSRAAVQGFGRNIGIPGTDIDLSHGLEALGVTPYEEVARQAEAAGPMAAGARFGTEMLGGLKAGGAVLSRAQRLGPLAARLSATGAAGMPTLGALATRGAIEGGTTAALIGQGNPAADLAAGAGFGAAGAPLAALISKPLGGFRDVSDDAKELIARGIPVTPGQAVNSRTALGSMVRGTEEAMTSAGPTGPILQTIRGRGLEALRKQALAPGLPPRMAMPKEAGLQPLKALEKMGREFSKQYDEALNAVPPGSLIPQGANIDELLRQRIPPGYQNDVIQNAFDVDDFIPRERIAKVSSVIAKKLDFEKLSARQMFAAQSDLRKLANKLFGSQGVSMEDRAVGEVYRRAADRVLSDLENGLPSGHMLQQLRGPYKNYINMRHEVEKLKGFGETLSPKGIQSAAKKAGNKDVERLARVGGSVLPSATPDSGTAGRMAMMAALGGAGGLLTGGDPESALQGAAIGAGAMLPGILGTTQAGSRFLLGQYPWQNALLQNAPQFGGVLGGLSATAGNR